MLYFQGPSECHVAGPWYMNSPVFMLVATKVQSPRSPLYAHPDQFSLLPVPVSHKEKLGIDILKQAGGQHKFMNWDPCLLTDSGASRWFFLKVHARNEEQGNSPNVQDGLYPKMRTERTRNKSPGRWPEWR